MGAPRLGEIASARLLTQGDLGRRLGASERTLETWRRRGIGPPFIRVGPKLVRYRLEDVERWLAACASGGSLDLMTS